jgi:hypothetical protein
MKGKHGAIEAQLRVPSNELKSSATLGRHFELARSLGLSFSLEAGMSLMTSPHGLSLNRTRSVPSSTPNLLSRLCETHHSNEPLAGGARVHIVDSRLTHIQNLNT